MSDPTHHDTQMLKGVLSPLLLALCRDRHDYGYSLVVRLQRAGFQELTEGSVYPALSRLEARGLLESYLARSASGPARKYYRITESGQVELARAGRAWTALVEAVGTALGQGPADAAARPETMGEEGYR
jgi:PadR family transcriptional regulator PadR